MDLGLSGRTALVCGASSGLGLASAEALSEEGTNVVLFARRAVLDEPLEHLVHDLFLQDLPLAERGQVVAQRLELEQLRVRDVADRELAEVGCVGERADRGELRRSELDEVVAPLEPVLDCLEH